MKRMERTMKEKLKFKGPMKQFMRWPLHLSLLLVVINVVIYMVDVKAGIFVTFGLVIYIVSAIGISLYHRPMILNDLIAFANQYDALEKRMLEDLALHPMDIEVKMGSYCHQFYLTAEQKQAIKTFYEDCKEAGVFDQAFLLTSDDYSIRTLFNENSVDAEETVVEEEPAPETQE